MNATIPHWRCPVVAAAALFFAGGCYTFTAVQGDPMVGADIRATVIDEEALKLSSQTGELSRTLDGRLVGITDDSLFVSIATFRGTTAVSGSRQFRQSLVIPRDGLETLEARELSVWRSALMGALAAAGVGLVVNQVVAGGSNEDDTDNGLPTGALVPLIRVTIGR